MLELLLLLMLVIFGVPGFIAVNAVSGYQAVPAEAKTAEDARSELMSLSPLPEHYLQQAYPNTLQHWKAHPFASEPHVYRVVLSESDGRIRAEGVYCLLESDDSLDWQHHVTLLEYGPDSSETFETISEPTVRTRLQAFVSKHGLKAPLQVLHFQAAEFYSPQTGNQQLLTSRLEQTQGYCIKSEGLLYWFTTTGESNGFPPHWH